MPAVPCMSVCIAMPSPPARPQGYNLSDHYSRLQGTRPLVTRLDGSILPAVVVPVTGFSAYALIVYFCYLIGLTPELGASALISILTMGEYSYCVKMIAYGSRGAPRRIQDKLLK